MQFCDFEALKKKGAEAELSRLVENEFISKSDADLVRLDEIELFIKSELFERIRGAQRVLRERRFNTRLPAKDFTTDPALKEALAKDNTAITVQGVVDCIFIDADGNAVLVDYKTDRLQKDELENEEKAKEKLISRHERQLKIYAAVCEQMIGRPFSEVLIYSLPLGKAIEVK
jgi:ATP-dependent helicase/nuclease subunit A